MGDRVGVDLYVPKWAGEVLVACGYQPDSLCDQPVEIFGGYYEECNGAEVGVEDTLRALEIPFNKSWGPGDNYTAGVERARFDEQGTYRYIELLDSELSSVMWDMMCTGDTAPVLTYLAAWRPCFNVPLEECTEPPDFQARWAQYQETGEDDGP